jgi:hypothetical protein
MHCRCSSLLLVAPCAPTNCQLFATCRKHGPVRAVRCLQTGCGCASWAGNVRLAQILLLRVVRRRRSPVCNNTLCPCTPTRYLRACTYARSCAYVHCSHGCALCVHDACCVLRSPHVTHTHIDAHLSFRMHLNVPTKQVSGREAKAIPRRAGRWSAGSPKPKPCTVGCWRRGEHGAELWQLLWESQPH